MAEYFNYSDIFLVEKIVKLQEYTKINDYVRKLKKVKQLVFEPIYSLELVKLEILKSYIKTNLINNFI